MGFELTTSLHLQILQSSDQSLCPFVSTLWVLAEVINTAMAMLPRASTSKSNRVGVLQLHIHNHKEHLTFVFFYSLATHCSSNGS